MKKICVLLLFICPFTKLYAEEAWSEWQDEKPLGENLIIEEEERYRWYKIIEKVEYTNIENEPNCEYFDVNDFILSEWITSYNTPEYKDYRTIKAFEIEQEKNTNIINSLHIFNLISNKVLNITEITIFKDSKAIPYTITDYTDFNIREFDKLYDNEIEEIALDFENHDRISLNLNNLTLTQNMYINITYLNENVHIETIEFVTGHDIYDQLTFQNIDNGQFSINCNEKTCELIIKLDEIDYIMTPQFPILIYKYQDKLFKCTNKSKEYLDGYYANIDNYVKDEDSKKIYYRYKIEYPNILNRPNELVVNKNDLAIVQKEEKNNDEVINTQIENIDKKEKTKQNNNYNLMFYIIVLFFIATIVYVIIKKIVNKNRAK